MLTLEEAIEILKKEQNDHHSYPTDIIGQAEGLGIEALKREQENRQGTFSIPLPGETEG